MQPKQISILSLHDMLFGIVSKQLTQLHEVIGLCNRCDDLLLCIARTATCGGGEVIEEATRATIEEVYYGTRKGESDDP